MRHAHRSDGIVHLLTKIERGADAEAVLRDSPVAAYGTDRDGVVRWWNAAAVELAGREPRAGEDRWCVTWRLHAPTGEPLPHDQCPMARAIQLQAPIRGEMAILERPDGSRAGFEAVPTPTFSRDGAMTGAFNLLVALGEAAVERLNAEAERCRRLSRAIQDPAAAATLRAMASGYEQSAASLA